MHKKFLKTVLIATCIWQGLNVNAISGGKQNANKLPRSCACPYLYVLKENNPNITCKRNKGSGMPYAQPSLCLCPKDYYFNFQDDVSDPWVTYTPNPSRRARN